jgi:hypothetical protein
MGLGLLAAAFAVVPLSGQADERPPAGTKTLVEVVTGLEKQEYGPITEISFDDGVWEVETYKADVAYEISVDPESGDVLTEHRDDGDRKPPTDSMRLSDIIAGLEKAGFSEVNDVSFEGRSWEAEARRDNQKRELRIDAKSGDVISDRVDD